jgi:hypothetical protein
MIGATQDLLPGNNPFLDIQDVTGMSFEEKKHVDDS